jgi:methylated-DNA-[protein]-cysteine S-methyltransferase
MPRRTCSVRTPFGSVVLIWSLKESRPKIERVFLPAPGLKARELAERAYPDAGRGSCEEIDRIAAGIASFLGGEDIRFSLADVRMDLCSDFQRRVLTAEHAIPRGWVSTYRRIAACVGSSRSARAVGRSLATNPFPIIIPCHRAIRSDAMPGGYQGGPAMKRALLEMEGIQFDSHGRVLVDAPY